MKFKGKCNDEGSLPKTMVLSHLCVASTIKPEPQTRFCVSQTVSVVWKVQQ